MTDVFQNPSSLLNFCHLPIMDFNSDTFHSLRFKGTSEGESRSIISNWNNIFSSLFFGRPYSASVRSSCVNGVSPTVITSYSKGQSVLTDSSDSTRHTGKDFVIHFSYVFMHSRPVVMVNLRALTTGERTHWRTGYSLADISLPALLWVHPEGPLLWISN